MTYPTRDSPLLHQIYDFIGSACRRILMVIGPFAVAIKRTSDRFIHYPENTNKNAPMLIPVKRRNTSDALRNTLNGGCTLNTR